MGRPAGDGKSEPSGQGREGERKDEAVVETVSEIEEEGGGGEQVDVPLAGEEMEPGLDVGKLEVTGGRRGERT